MPCIKSHINSQVKQYIFILLVILMIVSCQTTDEPIPLSGNYINQSTGEFVEFMDNGYFRYYIIADAHPTEIGSSSSYTGKYEFEKSGKIKITPISIHLGLFKIQVSNDQSKLLVQHRYSGRVAEFIREE